MADKVEDLVETRQTEDSAVKAIAKEIFHSNVEQPTNQFIRVVNYLTGLNLPKLDITGIPDRPLVIKYYKAGD